MGALLTFLVHALPFDGAFCCISASIFELPPQMTRVVSTGKMFFSAVLSTKQLISLNYAIFLLLTAPNNRFERQDQDNLHWNLGQYMMRSAHSK